MKNRFLKFMKQRFQEQGDCCPVYDWNKFIANEFSREERDLAIAFTAKLIENKYIGLIDKRDIACYAISGYGAEMIKRNKIEV